jgi:hypothetical protein
VCAARPMASMTRSAVSSCSAPPTRSITRAPVTRLRSVVDVNSATSWPPWIVTLSIARRRRRTWHSRNGLLAMYIAIALGSTANLPDRRNSWPPKDTWDDADLSKLYGEELIQDLSTARQKSMNMPTLRYPRRLAGSLGSTSRSTTVTLRKKSASTLAASSPPMLAPRTIARSPSTGRTTLQTRRRGFFSRTSNAGKVAADSRQFQIFD